MRGSSKNNTDNFTVAGKWQISWQVQGGAGVNIVVKTSSGASEDIISAKPGSSSSTLRSSGTFYLEVSPFGSTYTVIVTDLPD